MKSRFAASWVILAGLAGFQVAAARACAGDWERDEPVAVAAIDPRLDVRLTDGRLIRLAGFAAMPADAAAVPTLAAARSALEAELRGEILLLRLSAAAPDRWNRHAGLLLAPPDSSQPSAHRRVAAAGLARIADIVEAGDCAPALRGAEESARAAGLGLWADPYYAVRHAAQANALRELAGQFVVVEGRIRRVGRGRQRFYLDFGPTRQDFAVTIAMRTVRLLEKQNIKPLTLKGRTVRVRGWLDLADGPRLDLAGPGYIDVLPEAR